MMDGAPAVRSHPLPGGSTVAHYRVVRCIGTGGMGIVYAAQDLKLRRVVALKFLSPSDSGDPHALRRFKREAEAASALNHANICTIYDIDEAGGQPFIVMELLEGETLAQKCPSGPLEIRLVLDLGIQAAQALAAAHQAGIVHRDVKPANVFVTTGGQVKVLDFGLAKVRLPASAPTAETTSALTTAGTVMGTLPYMSPEQVMGRDVDRRSDLFSLGAVLYRMATGHSPFRGASAIELCDAILHSAPPPATQLNPEVPPELARVIEKALEKDPDLRYQNGEDLCADLKRVRRQMLGEVEPSGRRTQPQSRPVIARRFVLLAVVVAAALGTCAFLLFRSHGVPQLSERDTVVLADFDNRTGDAVFDETLKQALAADLQQSPLLNVLSDQRVRSLLQSMGRKTDDRLNEDAARDLCQRAGSKAVFAGSIAPLGSHFVLGLNAVNCSTGDSLAREQREVERKEDVLKALDQATSGLRRRLGESLASIRAFDKPLEEATTPSLEALRAFSQALRARWDKTDVDALPLLQRAVEIDPDFAWAYLNLAVSYSNLGEREKAAEYTAKAYALRNRTSEREKCAILAQYHLLVTGDLDKELTVSQGCAVTFPGYYVPPLVLGLTYTYLGRFDEAATATREALRLEPINGNLYGNLMESLVARNRIEEAKEIYRQAVARHVDNIIVHFNRYQIAILEGDGAQMQAQAAWAAGKPGIEDQFLTLGSLVRASSGQVSDGRAIARRAIDSATRSGRRELAGQWLTTMGLWEAELGQSAEARKAAADALRLSATRDVEIGAALVLAAAGQAARAQALADKLEASAGSNTMLSAYWLPTMRAAVALGREQPAEACKILQSVEPYENALAPPYVAALYPVYLLGQAYARTGNGAQAITAFQKLLDRRSIAPSSPLIPLARAAQARLFAAGGNLKQAQQACRDVVAMWRQADREVPAITRAEQDCRAIESAAVK